MSIIKNLISLSNYLTKNSLIKESKYLISLIKEAGYDWKEMSKTPHLKKDEYPESKKENTKIIQPETTTQEIANPDSESDSWLNNEEFEVPNWGMDDDYNINNNKDIELGDTNTDENFSREIIEPTVLQQIKDKFFGEYYDQESYRSFNTLLSVLSDEEDGFKTYVKYIAEENPIKFLSVLASKPKFITKFSKEINIAKKCIFDLTENTKKELLELVNENKINNLTDVLKDFKDVIIKNEKLLLFLINEGKEARSQIKDFIYKYNESIANYRELIDVIKRLDKEDVKKRLLNHLDEALLKNPQDFINQSFLSAQLESFILEGIIEQKEIDRYNERAREIIKNR
jgi:hypothetical protein